MAKLDWDREHRQRSIGPIDPPAGGLIEHVPVAKSPRVRSLYRQTVRPYGDIRLGWGPDLVTHHLQVNDGGWIPLRIVAELRGYLDPWPSLWSSSQDHDEGKPPRPRRVAPQWELNDVSYWIENRSGKFVVECRQGGRGPVRSAPYDVCMAVEEQWVPEVYERLESLHDFPAATAGELVKALRARLATIPKLLVPE